MLILSFASSVDGLFCEVRSVSGRYTNSYVFGTRTFGKLSICKICYILFGLCSISSAINLSYVIIWFVFRNLR